MLRAVCAWLWVHLECVFWRGVPGFALPPPRQSLPRFFHLFSPLTSSCSLIFTSIFSQLLRDRGCILILLLLVHPIIIALILNSGFGHYFIFFAASKSHPLILNHFRCLGANRCSLPGDAKSLPNYLAWGVSHPKKLCELSCCSVHFNPFKLGIPEQGWTSRGFSQILVTQQEEGVEPFWIFKIIFLRVRCCFPEITAFPCACFTWNHYKKNAENIIF